MLKLAVRYIFKNTVWAAIFIVWFALTVMSTVPWLWLMSIDAHWYSVPCTAGTLSPVRLLLVWH